ncbi:MAG: nitrile hydratase subunit beta [Alphaproteobacteria bacterium]|nr:nitrile hydratase subunit beta [Alphaproteobacteria bacterium]
MVQHHDVGGQSGRPLDRQEHDLSDFERRIDALCLMLCSPATRVVTVEELRRVKEQMKPAEYDALSYYERWTEGLYRLLVEKGVLSEAEIATKLRQNAEGDHGGVPRR